MPANAHYPSDPRGYKKNLNGGGLLRRRRVLILASLAAFLLFIFYVPWELPAGLEGVDVSRANFVSRFKVEKVDEIYGLLHIVTSEDEEQEHVLNNPQLDPTTPLELSVYAPALSAADWSKAKKKMDKDYPVIVFSKTWCPYSKLAKQILAAYDLDPPPKVIELDLRDDGGVIKALLTRITGRSTVPNIMVRGKSIGGASDIYPLSTKDELADIFREAGAVPQADGSKFRNEKDAESS